MTWGANDKGQLGLGNFIISDMPLETVGLGKVADVAAGNNHSLFLMADGSVMATGQNNNGQLGIGNYNNSNIAKRVIGLSGVVDLEAGEAFSMAVLNDGSVRTWG